MITLKKTKKIIPDVHKNEYKIRVNFMHGDADFYDKEVLYVEENNPYLQDFLKFLFMAENSYPNGRGGGDGYYGSVPGYNTFVEGYLEEEDEDFDLCICHPSYEGNESSFDGHVITYFDEDGVEWSVEEILDEKTKKEWLKELKEAVK